MAEANNRVLITGGAGFIGANTARRFIERGWDVVIWDNLSRKGGKMNLEWLRGVGPFQFTQIDLRNSEAVLDEFKKQKFNVVLHCAGQVAVTTSVVNPREDLEINVIGTFNILEGVRLHSPEALVIYASTNKVYGGMEESVIVERNGRYEYADLPFGVSEDQPLDFHSPYGCSKGAADQYVRDYARIYGLDTVCFRQSCIYGYRQFGVEDQGWVAWFIIAYALRKPITIFGDGKQTRDILFIDDLVDAYFAVLDKRAAASGRIYNIGGGPQNQFSLLQLLDLLNQETGHGADITYTEPRPGDQRCFVADIRKAQQDFGWAPAHNCVEGIRKLNRWVNDNLDLFR
jgi:CDP-paratose 2-epimerase